MCALLVGLPDVAVVGVGDWPGWLRIVIVRPAQRPNCCGLFVHRQGMREVELVDLPVFGRPTRLVWRSSSGAAQRVGGRGPTRTRGSPRAAAR